MFSARQISSLQKINSFIPHIEQQKPSAIFCSHCIYINENEFSFCTNCGFPLKDKQFVDAFNKRIQQRNNTLFKAENSVMVARIALYVMASFLSMGIFFVFAEGNRKYIIVLLAILLSGLFFFLGFWSRKNPFTALLTAFIVLIGFSGINIFASVVTSFTTLAGITGIFISIAILLVILKGVQGAYRINLIKEELQINI